MDNVLVIRFGSLGDVVLTLPVLAALRRQAPDARISVAVKEEFASLFDGRPEGVSVRPFQRSGRHRGLRGLRRYARELTRDGFGLIVDLHASVRSRLLTRLVDAPRVLRVSSRHLRRRALVRFRKPLLGYPGHLVDRYLEVLGDRTDAPVDRRPRLPVSEDGRAQLDAQLAATGVRREDPLVVVAPGAGRAAKRWPADRYAAVAGRLAVEQSMTVISTGAEGEADLVRQVVEQTGYRRVHAFVSSSLSQQAALLARASRLITNDSGLMHLGVAVGTPVLALFGPTAPSLGFYPLGEKDRVLSVPLDCRPCSLHGPDRCPKGHHACMDAIAVEQVLEAVVGGGEGA